MEIPDSEKSDTFFSGCRLRNVDFFVLAIFDLKILRKIFTGRLLFESDRC